MNPQGVFVFLFMGIRHYVSYMRELHRLKTGEITMTSNCEHCGHWGDCKAAEEVDALGSHPLICVDEDACQYRAAVKDEVHEGLGVVGTALLFEDEDDDAGQAT